MAGTTNHYADQYWNDLPRVLSHLSKRATGDAALWWMDYFKRRYATPPRKRALVFGCGTGWVERDLFDRGVAARFDAFDASPAYLSIAEKERGERPISYRNANFDDYVQEHAYDLIVNVASLHHVRYLYRMVHQLAGALEPDGLFVQWEYIGPSRNQYADQHLKLMTAIKQALPQRFRTPHPLRHEIATFLSGDPTEAVHASDIMDALRTELDVVEHKILGGGIAYQLLWNNIEEFRKDDAEARSVLDWLLVLDEVMTDQGLVPPLFAFTICRPKARRRLGPPVQRLLLEPAREKVASALGGRYLPEIWREQRTSARRLLSKLRGHTT